jgi:tetratricopeptide (TPR) repeat protein
MILFLAAAMAAAAPQADACPDVVTPDALVCRALSAQKSGDPQAAAQAFEEAAKASPDKEPATARMWAAAGNMWLAAAQPGKAAFALDQALALPGLEAEQRGEALLDRARAAEAQGDLKTARAKLTDAAASISADPFYWYFSAALAIRENDGATAQTAINRALALAPSDPTILFEAGHVAAFTGDDDHARSYWMRATGSDPTGEIG